MLNDTDKQLSAKFTGVPFAQVKSFKQLLNNMDRLEVSLAGKRCASYLDYQSQMK